MMMKKKRKMMMKKKVIKLSLLFHHVDIMFQIISFQHVFYIFSTKTVVRLLASDNLT